MNQHLQSTTLPEASEQIRKQEHRPKIWGIMGVVGGDQLFDLLNPVLPTGISELLTFLDLRW